MQPGLGGGTPQQAEPYPQLWPLQKHPASQVLWHPLHVAQGDGGGGAGLGWQYQSTEHNCPWQIGPQLNPCGHEHSTVSGDDCPHQENPLRG